MTRARTLPPTATTEAGPAILNLWHPVAALEDLRSEHVTRTRLLDRDIAVTLSDDRVPSAWVVEEEVQGAGATPDPLPTTAAYEFAWTSLGTPPPSIFAIPECDEPDRRNLSTGTIGVHVSAPRAVENFLDMGHFPYVHAGILGQVPRTEVTVYEVEVDPETNDLFARDCEFFQPVAAVSSLEGHTSLLHPVAGRSDLAPRHVARSRLLGQDLAIWAADDGFINVWADRCIHRGVRLSVGINDGAELACQYHGWRYSNRNGNCAYIPAHPGNAPARTLCVPTFGSAEKYGLVWSGGSPAAAPPTIPALEGGDTLVLRSLPVNAPAARQGLTWELHYFAQSDDHIAFPEVLDHLPAGLTKHLGLSPAQTTDKLQEITENYLTTSHAYVCGPGPMIEAARALATESGWPEEAVHFEYFKNESAQDDTSTFEVLLARRNETLVVNAGVSLLESLRSAGVDMPSSCEQGVCGTCMVTVLDGEPDHQDVYFSDLRDAHAILIYLAGKYDPAATWYPTHDPQLLGEHARITPPCAGGPNVSGACRASSRCPASFPSRHCRHE